MYNKVSRYFKTTSSDHSVCTILSESGTYKGCYLCQKLVGMLITPMLVTSQDTKYSTGGMWETSQKAYPPTNSGSPVHRRKHEILLLNNSLTRIIEAFPV